MTASPHPTVALLLFQVPSCGDEWLPEMPFAACAAELRAQGIGAEVVHVLLDAAEPAQWQATEDALILALATMHATVVVFDQLPSAAIGRRLRDEVGAVLVDAAPWGGDREVPPDFAVSHLNTCRGSLTALCAALARGQAVDAIANVRRWNGAAMVATPAGECVLQPLPMTDYLIRREHRFFPATYRPVARQRALQTSTGCPYQNPLTKNPAYRAIDLSRQPANNGCAFCTIGGRYEAPNNTDSVQILATEIATIRRLEPEVSQIFLSDQMPLRYLVALIRQLVADQLLPICLMFSTRVDWLVQYSAELREAAATMAGAGGQLGFYLAGFETFSPHLAAVYNKSSRPDQWPQQCADAIALLKELRRNHGDAFVLDAGATSFIVQSPWTTLHDLRLDAEAIDMLGLGEVAAEAPFSKLRLYEGTALTAKARAEGLLTADDAQLGLVGYAPTVAWRFGDPLAERAALLLDTLRDCVQPVEYAGLMWAVVRLVEQEAAGTVAVVPATECRDQLLALQRALAAAPEVHRDELLCPVGASCNNGCRGCTGRHLAPQPSDALTLADSLLDRGQPPPTVLLGGREPTMLPDLPGLVRQLRQGGVQRVGMVTNGRRLAIPRYTQALAIAGLNYAVVQWAGRDADSHDGYTQVPGSFGQMRIGLANLRQAGIAAELLVVAGASDSVRTLAAARASGTLLVRLRLAIGELELAQMPALTAALSA